MVNRKILRYSKEYTNITFGLFLSALGWTAFIIPSNITGGGVNGLATLLYFVAGIKVAVPILIVNLVLLVAALKVMGLKFGVKTLYGVSMLSFFFWLLQSLITEPFVNEEFMAAVVGGALSGVGSGIVLSQGGSSGGTTIVAMMINKNRNVSPGKVMMGIDVLVISCSWFVFHNIEVIIYGLVTMMVTSYVSDIVLSGNRQSFQVFIFSTLYDKIADQISEEVGRGITLWEAKGWHSNQDRQVLMIMAKKHEIGTILRIIKEIDKNAYVSQAQVRGMFGPGFDNIKK